MVGPFSVNVVSLDDTDPDTGHWGADQVVTNARRAIADRNIMGYIGDSGSGATALTLPLLNEAGVLQIGPTTGYVGLTRPAGRGEPDRFYPSGVRSFGRIAPADDIQADALVETMRAQGVRRLAILQDGELEALGIAGLVEKRAHEAGIDVVELSPSTRTTKTSQGSHRTSPGPARTPRCTPGPRRRAAPRSSTPCTPPIPISRSSRRTASPTPRSPPRSSRGPRGGCCSRAPRSRSTTCRPRRRASGRRSNAPTTGSPYRRRFSATRRCAPSWTP